jgi:hypothetical protein
MDLSNKQENLQAAGMYMDASGKLITPQALLAQRNEISREAMKFKYRPTRSSPERVFS